MTTRKFRIKIDGKIFEAEVEEISGEEVGKPVVKTKETPSSQIAPPSTKAGKSIVAPMPGKIIKINVSKGQKIKKGDVILVIEAMKMEQEINSSLEGTVTDLQVSEGDMVKKEQILIVLG